MVNQLNASDKKSGSEGWDNENLGDHTVSISDDKFEQVCQPKKIMTMMMIKCYTYVEK